MLSAKGREKTPLTAELDLLTLWIGAAAGLTMFVMIVLGRSRGEAWDVLFVSAVTLAIAAVPEALPTVTQMILSLGGVDLAAHNAIVKELPSVETLGLTSAINPHGRRLPVDPLVLAQPPDEDRVLAVHLEVGQQDGDRLPDDPAAVGGHPVLPAQRQPGGLQGEQLVGGAVDGDLLLVPRARLLAGGADLLGRGGGQRLAVRRELVDDDARRSAGDVGHQGQRRVRRGAGRVGVHRPRGGAQRR
jgi:hypothetical protein